MAVVSMVVGAPTPDGATFVAKVDGGGPVRVAVATDEAMSSPTFTSSQPVDAQGVAKVSITGLTASTRYWWQVEDNSTLDTSVTGRFRTLPPAGSIASFTIAASGDAGASDSGFVVDRVSNHPVFDTIREADPLLFVHMGDYHYRDIGSGVHSPLPADETDYRDAMDDLLAQPRQSQAWREIPIVPTWDNHDYGFLTGSAIDSDGDLPHKAAARAVFQERWPHYPLAAGSGDVPIYYDFQIGRVHFVMLDVRSERDPNTDTDDASKTMLGTAQKAWLDNLLATSTASALCIISAGQWITQSSESDTWNVYSTERDELVAMFTDHGWLNRMFMLTASMHALGLDRGSGNIWGNFPVALFASLDATPSAQVSGYDQGLTQPGVGQWGTVQVTDLGSSIIVKLTGFDSGGEWDSIQFGIVADAPAPAGAAALLRALTGSHRAAFEVRVLADFQTGPDPDGDLLEIVGGQVRMDGTADVQRTLNLNVAGEQFPRRLGDKLLPDGTEIFVRRGVDVGSDILWSPLGYFRIYNDDQDDAPDGPIPITAYDRMIGIVEGELLQPVRFDADDTYGEVFTSLVGAVYAGAVITFDDALGSQAIGRPLDVERSRIEILRTLAHGRGKILHWDGEGVLRVRTAPDPSEPVWAAAAGTGVLSRARRRITRRDVKNAAVVRSQGGDTLTPALAIAIDDGPHSITRVGGRFGTVPAFLSTPADTSQAQAQDAARQMLLRRAGLPYQVEFTAVPNPSLQPYDPIRVTLRDGTREKHVLEKLTIPLVADALMSASTREQRLSRVVVRT